MFIALLHLTVLLMSVDLQSKPFPYRLVFIGLFSCDFPLVPQTLPKFLFYSVPFWSLMAKCFERESIRIGLLDMDLQYSLSLPSVLLVVQNWFGIWFLTLDLFYIFLNTTLDSTERIMSMNLNMDGATPSVR